MPRLLRRVYAPSRPREDRDRIVWTFHGSDAVNKPRRWQLTYDAKARTFAVANATKLKDSRNISSLFDHDAATMRRDVKGRTVADALRSCLPKEDIVLCTRKSLTLGATP